MQTIRLKPGKEVSVKNRHPWIFSGAIDTRASLISAIPHGGIVGITSADGKHLGTGTFSPGSSIAVRVFDFSDTPARLDEDWFIQKFESMQARRILAVPGLQDGATTAYRLCFGEADGIPGLVADRYGASIVLQSSTAGMDALLPVAVKSLVKLFNPQSVVERSDIAVRREDKLEPRTGLLYRLSGEMEAECESWPVEFIENGLKFEADLLKGQKTGFFLDQRVTRENIRRFASGRAKVLNLFSYSCSAGISALAGSAGYVLNVDESEHALEMGRRNAALNSIEPEKIGFERAEAFNYLAGLKTPEYDMLILDPPALIKSKKDLESGLKAYHFLNRASMRAVKTGGIFVTSSCSHLMTAEKFEYMLRRASVQAGVTLDVLALLGQPADHPRSVYFTEGDYLVTIIGVIGRA